GSGVTGVEFVQVGFRTAHARDLVEVGPAELREHLGRGEFAPGSMAPKVAAALSFLAQGGREVIITRPESLLDAMSGRTGTRISGHETS
ncbi:MAG TPA: carbamate kinase, partial [Myxococcota bacterium]|nr:carbamate kinase [Myxococcota bacterium]